MISRSEYFLITILAVVIANILAFASEPILSASMLITLYWCNIIMLAISVILFYILKWLGITYYE